MIRLALHNGMEPALAKNGVPPPPMRSIYCAATSGILPLAALLNWLAGTQLTSRGLVSDTYTPKSWWAPSQFWHRAGVENG